MASCGDGSATEATTDSSVSVNFDAQEADGSLGSVGTVETVPLEEPTGDQVPSRMLYVSMSGDKAIRVLRLGPNGSLTRLEALDLELDGQPGPIVVATQRRRLYVGVDEGFQQTVDTISIGNEGELEKVVRDVLLGNPVYLDLSRDEASMVSAYFGDDAIAGHVLPVGANGDGTIVDQTTDRTTDEEPHAAHFNPAHNLVYVPHRAGNKISWFSLNGSELSLVGEISVNGRAGPRHIVFSSDGEFAYVINETSVDVSVYEVDREGGLSLIQTITALPPGRQPEGNSGADIHLTPDGRFLYASVRGDDSIAGFRVSADGLLDTLARTLTEQRPREFSITPDGRYLVAAGQDSGALASYQIRENGTLVLLDTQEVGNGPVWVAID